jgi:AmmeMemoRadiSam system protein B/AmmeMemoRadiSam system protein A
VVDRQRQATYCPGCSEAVVARDGYRIESYAIRGGSCAKCGTPIAGRFDDAPGAWGGRRVLVHMADYVHAPRGPVVQERSAASMVSQPELSAEQEQRVFQAAAERVAAAAMSRRPVRGMHALLGDAAGVPVYGAFVSLKRAGRLRGCCGFIGQTVPLAEALDHAAVRATTDDPRFPRVQPAELARLDMDVWLLWGLQPVAARGEDRAAGIVIGRHGVQIARGAARGLLLPCVAIDHHLGPRELLQQVSIKAGLPPDAWLQDDTVLMTFEGRSISGRLPGVGLDEAVRLPAVAGGFYPASPDALQRMLDEMFSEPCPVPPETWAAAMVPHAGWIYSGRLAAAVLRRLKIPDQVIVLCPKHRPGGANWAVAPHTRWEFPGGAMAGDLELARRLALGIEDLELDASSHSQEHAIEVQLPLLARVNPATRVVGITIGAGDWPRLQRFAQQLAEVLRLSGERPLLLVSSDMNHFADDAETRRLDRLALDAMASLDPARLYQTVECHRISMCGMRPAAIVMETLRRLDGLHVCEEVGYTTSAEASGETNRVVGYAGLLLK